jgi:exoribonuclease R
VASEVNEITINYSDDEILLVKELEKEVLTKGAWATLMFKYQDWDRQKQDYGPIKFTIRRYRKLNDEYRQQTKFNISSADQANKIIEVLQRWVNESAS